MLSIARCIDLLREKLAMQVIVLRGKRVEEY